MSYKNAARDQRTADTYLGSFMACSFCQAPTEISTLSDYGARCGACFQAYLLQGQVPHPLSVDEKFQLIERMKAISHRLNAGAIEGSRASRVANRLLLLQESGVRLTDSQKHVLKACEDMCAPREELA